MSAQSFEPILPQICSPRDLQNLTPAQLKWLATEIREELCSLSNARSVHFASNLGVVELCIALHRVFDFSKDRLIWDTGHQCYPHKILTGRANELKTIRTHGGLMGFPNPEESEYDLMMTGHAGCSVGTALGLACGDDLQHPQEKRHSVAVIGDGAFSSGVVFESLNHAGWLKKNMTVILNDNKMSICPRVGGLSTSLDQLRMNSSYLGIKQQIHRFVSNMPLFKTSTESFLSHLKAAIKAGFLGGMFFEELGFRYIGPVDGHNIEQLQSFLRMVREYEEPVLLHVFTEKGRGYKPAENDPTTFHAPAPLLTKSRLELGNSEEKEKEANTKVKVQPDQQSGDSSESSINLPIPTDQDCLPSEPNSYTFWVRETVLRMMQENEKVCIITAAMCQGNMLEPIREQFPDRFFDVGICESHAVLFAAGLAKTGLRPIVDIYSTFLQRSYDQLFQEISLQRLPVLFLLDRAGLAGPDGPTHHGVFDVAYMRHFPNLQLLSPGDPTEIEPMIRFALSEPISCAIRYPKCTAPLLDRQQFGRDPISAIERGRAELICPGRDGMFAVYGGLLPQVLAARNRLATELPSLDFGIINARFAKPLDRSLLLQPLREGQTLITVEEGVLAGGFGSAVLEAACDEHLDTRNLNRRGMPDYYVPHGERGELLGELGLDGEGLAQFARKVYAERFF
ncbi:MAG: 1-deoxy-D-xylulose-5-phosphate synthase [Thermoguttaceae bacterium]